MSSTNATVLMSEMVNSTSMSGLVGVVNSSVNGLAGVIVWCMLVIPMFIGLKYRGYYSSDAFASCSFFGFVLCLLLRGLNIVPEWFFYTNIILLALGAVFLVVSGSKS